MIHIVRFILIVLAYICLPLYGLWVAGGAIADRMEKRRCMTHSWSCSEHSVLSPFAAGFSHGIWAT